MSVAVMFEDKVVVSSNVDFATPPTVWDLTAWNLTMSLFTLALFGSDTLTKVELEAVVKGLIGKKSVVPNSVLAGLAVSKPCGSATNGFGSNCGCLRSNSE